MTIHPPAEGPPADHYRRPGEYVALLRAARADLDAGKRVSLAWNGPAMDREAFLRAVVRALHRRINAKGGIDRHGRKHDEIYQTELARDRNRIQARVTRRVRMYQIHTPELRARFAHLIDRYDD